MAKQGHSCWDLLALTVLSDDGELAAILQIILFSDIGFVFVGAGAVYVIINWIFDASKAEATIEDGPTILLITLTETRVLVQLRQYLIQRGNRVVALQMFELLLDGSAGQLVVLALLQEMAVVPGVDTVWK